MPVTSTCAQHRHERAYADLGDAEAVEESDQKAKRDCRDDADRHRGLDDEIGGRHRGHGADRADREIEAAEDDHQQHAAGDDANNRVSLKQVRDVSPAEEMRNEDSCCNEQQDRHPEQDEA
jgi:hypothetical protein